MENFILNGEIVEPYDSFLFGGQEIVEYTGLQRRAPLMKNGEILYRPVFKNISGSTARKRGEILIFTDSVALSQAGLIKINRTYHPLCQEIGRMMKDQPGFFRGMIKYFTIIYLDTTPKGRVKFEAALREELSEEIKNALRLGCDCDECSTTAAMT